MPTVECVPTIAGDEASNGTVLSPLRCHIAWKLAGLVFHDSELERAIGTIGFVVFVLVAIGYTVYSVYVQQRGWFTNAKLMALYVGLAILYPFAFLSGVVLIRGADNRRVNIFLLLAQAWVWYAFLRRVIAVMLRVRRTRDGDTNTAHAEYKSNKRHARHLTVALLVALTAGQVAGGVVQLLALFAAVGLAILLVAVDLYGALDHNGSGSGGGGGDSTSNGIGMHFPRLWREMTPLRIATQGVGVYSFMLALLSPGFVGAIKVNAEAVLVLLEHIALAILAFYYWHATVAVRMAKTSVAHSKNAWGLGDVEQEVTSASLNTTVANGIHRRGNDNDDDDDMHDPLAMVDITTSTVHGTNNNKTTTAVAATPPPSSGSANLLSGFFSSK